MASIFDLTSAELEATPSHLLNFLDLRVSEGLNLEYKQKFDSQRVLESIAAMSNTYGGLIIIGVTASGDQPEQIVGVDSTSREALVNQCHAKFAPPLHPDVVPIDIEGKTVLVVRIDIRNVVRPVVLDGKVWVRAAGRNAPADLFRMRSLFAEEQQFFPSRLSTHMLTMAPSTYNRPIEQDLRALIVRSGIEVALPTTDWPILLETSTIEALISALKSSPVNAWLAAQMDRWQLSDFNDWAIRSRSTSNQVKLSWQGLLPLDGTPVLAGQCVLSIPDQLLATGGNASLLVDVVLLSELMGHVLTKSSGQEMPTQKVTIDEIFELLDASIESAGVLVPEQIFPQLLGIPVWEQAGPADYIDAYDRPLDSLIDYGTLNRYPQANHAYGAQFPMRRGVNIADTAERRQLVATWLKKLMLDEGAYGFEATLDELIEAED